MQYFTCTFHCLSSCTGRSEHSRVSVHSANDNWPHSENTLSTVSRMLLTEFCIADSISLSIHYTWNEVVTHTYIHYITLLLLKRELCVLLIIVLHPAVLICDAVGSDLDPSIVALVGDRTNDRKSSPIAPVKSASWCCSVWSLHSHTMELDQKVSYL